MSANGLPPHCIRRFVTQYLSLILFPILYGIGKFLNTTPFVKPLKMDFVGGLAEIDAESTDERPPRNAWEKFWAWLVRRAYSDELELP
jgi:amino acid transporter